MKTAKEILHSKDRQFQEETFAYNEQTIIEAMDEYAAQFIHPTNCYQCEGTGNIVISINPDGQDYTQTCMNCKGVGKVIMLPMQQNT